MTAIGLLLAFLLAWSGTWALRGYALRRLLDVPNERSSHRHPTPRGGGMAVVVAHLAVLAGAWRVGGVDDSLLLALGGGGLLVALVGFMDDHRPLPASLRLGAHLVAVVWACLVLGGLPPVDFGAGPVALGHLGTVLFVLYATWYLNLFNFMDGIDGIAGVQAISMCASAAGLALLAGHAPASVAPLGWLAAASAGFLVWNWPPARIFLGDAGSGYIGFALGVLALWSVVHGLLGPWTWLILGGVFLADATVTLVQRWRAGARLASAHRSHAYQRLARAWGSHAPVTRAVLAIDLLWCLPWALLAERAPAWAAVVAALALAPLFALAWWLGAGRAESAPDA